MTLPGDLRGFCYNLVREHGDPAALIEERKADEFRKMFMLETSVTVKDIIEMAVQSNININALEGMPANLRGYHEIYDENQTIYYRQGDTASGIENTILHEIREMMEPYFAEVCPSYKPLDKDALHIAANRFASAVLLPRERFTGMMYEMGLDVFELAGYYVKSLSQVLLRMGEVLNGRHFFYGALYEFDPMYDTWTLNYCTLSPSLFPEPDFSELGAFFPTRGTAVTPGSLVDMAIKERRPFLGRILTLLDSFPKKGQIKEGLVGLARPVPIGSNPTKVVLLVVLGRDKELLLPQVRRIKPEIIKGCQSTL